MSCVDKRSIFQVLGSLMQKPSLLDEDKYKLTKDDFHIDGESSFYKIIFATINNLYEQGIEDIDFVVIDNFLSNYDVQYKIFNDNDGMEYLQNAIENSNIKNFDYNYYRVKKFSLLRAYHNNGFDISEIYNESLINPREQEEMQHKFDIYTLQDIINIFEEKQTKIRSAFLIDDNVQSQHAADGIDDLIDGFKEAPDFGGALPSKIMNAVYRGAKPETLFMRSAPSNLGKTRSSIADATHLAVDELYDTKQKKWICNGVRENVLFISTEMPFKKLRPTILAYISAVEEEKIKDATYDDEEYQRVKYAAQVLKRANFYLEYIPNFDTNDIETLIKKHILENQAQYIFFDYVHISYKVLQELADQSKGMKMREDMVLFMFIYRLKQLTQKYKVFISTSSQVNGEWKNIKDADSTILRGAKSMADKLDNAVIALRPTKSDLESLEPILREGFYAEPNVVYHIYKNRETKHVNVKLWLHMDMGTMRTTDLFLTDNDYNIIPIEAIDIENYKEEDETEDENKKFDF